MGFLRKKICCYSLSSSLSILHCIPSLVKCWNFDAIFVDIGIRIQHIHLLYNIHVCHASYSWNENYSLQQQWPPLTPPPPPSREYCMHACIHFDISVAHYNFKQIYFGICLICFIMAFESGHIFNKCHTTHATNKYIDFIMLFPPKEK